MSKSASMGELEGENHCWTNRRLKKPSWWSPKLLWQYYMNDETAERFGRFVSHYIWHKLTQHFTKRTSYTNMVVVWWLADLSDVLWLMERSVLLPQTILKEMSDHQFVPSSSSKLGGKKKVQNIPASSYLNSSKKEKFQIPPQLHTQ